MTPRTRIREHPRTEQLAESHLLDLARRVCLDASDLAVGEGVAADPGKDRPGQCRLAVLDKPPRAFRDEEHENEEERGRKGSHAEHPPPAGLDIAGGQPVSRQSDGQIVRLEFVLRTVGVDVLDQILTRFANRAGA